jgi:hypothetical protein
MPPLQIAVVGTGILFLTVQTTATRKQLAVGARRKKRSLVEVGDEDDEDELMFS